MVTSVKKSGRKIILEILKDPERKSIFRITSEFLYLAFFYCRLPLHYFSRYLFKKGRNNITAYYPDSYLHKLKYSFNDFNTSEVLENKLYFSLYFNRLEINTPEILMFNDRTTFVTGNTGVIIKHVNDFKSILYRIFSDNPDVQSIFVKKMSGSYGGDRVFKIYLNEIENDSNAVSELFTEVTKSEYLFQKTIIQHSQMERMNPSCLNTIRIDTFLDKEGKPGAMSAYLRTSISGLHVDNISSGGCRIPIDMEKGELKKTGFSSLKTSGVKVFEAHPLTNVKFEGFTIPCFDMVKELVLKAAGYIPSLRLVGWDVGIEETGPVLIEGNSYYNIVGNDFTSGGYRTHNVFRNVIREHKELKKQKRFRCFKALFSGRQK